MKDYLFFRQNDCLHYFYKQGGGLYVRHGTSRPQRLFPDCRGVFSVLQNNSDETEILCLNTKNELVYLLPATGKVHILTRIGDGMDILHLRLFNLAGKTHFLYSARYHGEIFLVYSPLDNNAMPKTLIKIRNPWFYFYKTSVYVTAQNGATGYLDLTYPEPTFNRITDNADSVCLFSINGADVLVYKKGSEIFFQNRPVCTDKYAETPIAFAESNTLFLMWKSRGFLLYQKSVDSGRTWSGVGRIITPAREAVLAFVEQNGSSSLRYIENSCSIPRLLGSAPHSAALAATPTDPAELEMLRATAQRQKNEISLIKKELDELKKHLTQTDIF